MTDAERDPAQAGDAPDPITARRRAIEAQVAALAAEAGQLTRLAALRGDLEKQGAWVEALSDGCGHIELLVRLGDSVARAVDASPPARSPVRDMPCAEPAGLLVPDAWTPEEEDLLWGMHLAGKTAREIARQLDRNPQSVGGKLTALKRRRGAESAPATALRSHAPALAPVRDVPRAAPVETAAPDRPSGWTAARDLVLVEGILRGRKLADLAPELELGTDDLKARWKQLMPVSSIEGQRRLVTRLRAEVAGEDAT